MSPGDNFYPTQFNGFNAKPNDDEAHRRPRSARHSEFGRANSIYSTFRKPTRIKGAAIAFSLISVVLSVRPGAVWLGFAIGLLSSLLLGLFY